MSPHAWSLRTIPVWHHRSVFVRTPSSSSTKPLRTIRVRHHRSWTLGGRQLNRPVIPSRRAGVALSEMHDGLDGRWQPWASPHPSGAAPSWGQGRLDWGVAAGPSSEPLWCSAIAARPCSPPCTGRHTAPPASPRWGTIAAFFGAARAPSAANCSAPSQCGPIAAARRTCRQWGCARHAAPSRCGTIAAPRG